LRLAPERTDAATALATIWRGEAQAAITARDTEKALSLLIQARKVTPDDAEVQFEFGVVALRMSLLPDAIDGFQRSPKVRPTDPKALYGLGRAFMESSKFDDSRQQFEKYIELRPEDASGHFALGMTYASLERSSEARKEFERSISLAPVQTESYFRLGVLELASKHLDAAENNLRHVLERDAKHSGALAALGRVEFERKKYAESAERCLCVATHKVFA
jgi:Flp pilus assembly protein TadD